jgi:mannose-6-phosphate isomerase
MNNFLPKPYKLFNKIQNYDWGTKNENAFIANTIGINAQRDLPYAELWIGAHPKASSEIEIDGKKIQLKDFIDRFTNECLGGFVSKKFNGRFPFLLKILSADRALSIQTHPNKKEAEMLHKKDPINYPDDNHKPEIAIAVDSLIAIAGFRPVNEIAENIKSLPELHLLVGEKFVNDVITSETDTAQKQSVKNLYSELMRKAEDKNNLSVCVSNIFARLNSKENLSPEEEQFLIQHKLYGADIGLFSFFFFNMVQLQPASDIYRRGCSSRVYQRKYY